eukprot:Sspe_Gene.90150::Locus_61762_Transcript_1_1_Confidence_1.000_Length_998::g.90150::m.90150
MNRHGAHPWADDDTSLKWGQQREAEWLRLQGTSLRCQARIMTPSQDASLGGFIEALRSAGTRVVAFDMDQTMVRCHSRGCLRKEEFDEYAASVSEDFVKVVPALASAGFKLAVATHSDR